MNEATFAEMIRSSKTAIGTILSTSSPEVAEVISNCGFDWLFLDMEHGAIDISGAQQVLQAVRNDVPVAVRVPDKSELWIRKVLDIGSAAVIVPLVNNAQEAQSAVRAAKYPPAGERSVGIARAHGYGQNFASYVERANTDTSVIVQIEHIEAVKNIHEIIAVEGIDGVFVGPYDLSGSMNLLGDVSNAAVQDAIESVASACQQTNMPMGIFAMTVDTAQKMIDGGFSFVAVGIDMALLASSAQTVLNSLKLR